MSYVTFIVDSIPVYKCTISIHFIAEGHLCCFCFFTNRNNATMNILIHIFWCPCTWGDLWSQRVCISSILLDNGKLFSRMVVPVYNLISRVWQFSLSSAREIVELHIQIIYVYKIDVVGLCSVQPEHSYARG